MSVSDDRIDPHASFAYERKLIRTSTAACLQENGRELDQGCTCRRAKWQWPLFAEIRKKASNLVLRHSNPE